MTEFQIHPLSEKPEYAEVCAAWSYAEWGCYMSDWNLADSIASYKIRSQNTDKLDLCWLAITQNKPAGMISLKENDHPDRKDLKPWLASVFVHPAFRNKGYASALINRAHDEAQKLGFQKMYLFTPNAEGLYQKHGWYTIGSVPDTRGIMESEPLMEKVLN